MTRRATRAASSLVVAVAAAIVLVAIAIVPFLNPAWVAVAQDRADAASWTGYSPDQLRLATDAILSDLLLGPPDFDVEVGGRPVLGEAERGHMQDVRGVFGVGALVAVVAAGALAIAARTARSPAAFWRAVRGGAAGLAVGIALIGLVAVVAFDAAFEIFHRLVFSGGNFTFDPATDRLVQLFPQRFWFETSLAVGVLIVVLAAATIWLATRRLRAEAASPTATVPQATLEAAR